MNKSLTFDFDLSALDTFSPLTQGAFKPEPNGQDLFFHSQKHIVVLGGGNKAGKTYCGTVRVGYRTMPELDKYGNKTGWLLDPYVRSRVPDRRIVGWISTYSQSVQEGTVQKMVQRIYGEKSGNIKDHYAEGGTWFNYQTELADVFFRWITAQNSTYTGANLDFVYMDEPHPRDIFNEAITRLLENHGYAWITLTPVIDSKDQDFARKMKYISWMVDDLIRPFNENPDSVPEVDVIYADIEDNSHVDSAFAMRMWATLTDEERMIRKTGMFADFIGDSAFNADMLSAVELYINEHKGKCRPRYGKLDYDDKETDDEFKIRFIQTVPNFPDKPDKDYIWKIWEEPVGTLDSDTIYGNRPDYVIGVDPAAGKRGRDYTSAYVRRKDTGAVVAALHGYITERELSYQLWLGGQYYCSSDNRPALLVIENVSYGRVTISKLISGDADIGLPQYDLGRLYRTPARGALEKGMYLNSDEYGWYTSNRTRPFLIDVMRKALADCYYSISGEDKHQCLIPDLAWVKEAKTFILHENGKYEAAPAFYDDRLFALALADIGTGRYSEKIILMPQQKSDVDDDVTFYMKNGRRILNIDGLIARNQKVKRGKVIFY